MKFGKEFRIHLEETLPEWRDKYLCYKPLKKLLKNIPTTAESLPPAGDPIIANPPPAADGVGRSERNMPPLAHLQDWFIRILAEELDKFNDFYVDKEEEFVIRFQELKERIERVMEKRLRDGVSTTDGEFSNEMMDIRKDFVTIHGEMVLLKNYSSMNFAGLVKILKKYDKRTGGLLQIPFTQLALRQPFFTTEPLTRLVRECEAKLELLFPLEAEVVEAPTIAEEQKKSTSIAVASISPQTSLSLGEETVDIYRSTLAAIRTIQGLRRGSSTYNPLSFTSLFGKEDNDSIGAVTAENSASDSLDLLQNGNTSNQDDVDSIE